MSKELTITERADGKIRGQLLGLRAYLSPSDPVITNTVEQVVVDEHEVQVRAHAMGMQGGDRRRLDIDIEPAEDLEGDIAHAQVDIAPRWFRRGRRHHLDIQVDERALQQDPVHGQEVLNELMDQKMKVAGHNMVHSHRLRSVVGLVALFGVGKLASDLYKKLPEFLPNVTLVNIKLPFVIDFPWHVLPSIQDIRLTTAFLAGAAVGFIANRVVHFIGEQVHEWRADRRFALYDRIVSQRKPSLRVVPVEQQMLNTL